MKTKSPPKEKPGNALVQNALDSLRQIDADAKQKKLAQLASLNAARDQIAQRLKELQHQLDQIGKVFEVVRGQPAEARPRRKLDGLRQQTHAWLMDRAYSRFRAGEIAKAIPELEGANMSYLLAPLVKAGKVKMDKSGGIRRAEYYVES